MADVKVVPIPEGCIIAMRGVRFATAEARDHVLGALLHAAGHDRFAVLTLDPDEGDVEVWGPDDNVTDKLRDLLDRSGLLTHQEDNPT